VEDRALRLTRAGELDEDLPIEVGELRTCAVAGAASERAAPAAHVTDARARLRIAIARIAIALSPCPLEEGGDETVKRGDGRGEPKLPSRLRYGFSSDVLSSRA